MSIQKHLYREDGQTKSFVTTNEFWECDCNSESGFYHSYLEPKCNQCGASKDECPDARPDEMLAKLNRPDNSEVIAKKLAILKASICTASCDRNLWERMISEIERIMMGG